MNGKFVPAILITLILLVVVAVGVGYYAYGAGVAQGVLDSGKLVAPAPGVVPYPYYGVHYRPFGFGFGFLGCFAPLLFFFLIFGLMRAMFGRGHWGWRGHMGHYGEKGAPTMFEEWHKRAHEPEAK